MTAAKTHHEENHPRSHKKHTEAESESEKESAEKQMTSTDTAPISDQDFWKLKLVN